MNLKEELEPLIAGEVFDDVDVLNEHSRDASIFQVTPQLVVYPKNADDISKLVEFVNSADKHLSLTARSGGTCMSGGSLTESIVVDVSRHLNRLVEMGPSEASVQPGMYYRDFEDQLQRYNLLLPSYPASKSICTLGGMVNNNAGGEKTLSYGKTEKYVKSMKAVFSDGHEYVVRPLTKNELGQKMSQQDFEGKIYREIFRLIEQNHKSILRAKPAVSKNSTGYSLWNVWDNKTFDLTQLLVGSQGTLAITTEITFKLVTPKPQSAMLVIFLQDLQYLAETVQRVLTYYPESFESYDRQTLKLALRFAPRLFKRGGLRLFSLFSEFLPEISLLLSGSVPQLILLAEFSGHSASEVLSRAQSAQASLRGYPLRTRLSRTAEETKKYWTIRHESFNLLREKSGTKKATPFIDDFCVSPAVLNEFLPELYELLSHYDIFYTIAGHAGDGNFHIIPLMDLTREKERHLVSELSEKVYDLVFKYKGSMSGEHNDGLVRSAYLEKMYGPRICELFAATKKIFDPNNIFNPGKKVGADWQYSLRHLASD